MNQRLMLSFRDIADPDLRLSIGIRLYIKRAHEDPEWGLFISRFGFHSSALRQLGASHPIKILMDGIQSKRYNLNIDQLSSCIAMLTDRKSTRLNSSHVRISYAVFCLKKK